MSVFTNPAAGAPGQAEQYIEAILGLLGDRDPVMVLRATPQVVRDGVNGLSAEQLGTREAPGKWSVRHVVQHLADSELVWGYRVRMILAHDRPQLTGYDQDLWATRLGYEQSDVEATLDLFRVLRETNLALLDRVPASDLQRVAVHAERGEESVERMLRLNAGHDLLHLHEIDRIKTAIGAGAR